MTSIEELEYFFKLDSKLKNLIEISRPNIYAEDPIQEEKNLLKILDTCSSGLMQMIFMTKLEIEDEIDEKIDAIKRKIYLCNYNLNTLVSIYENDILKLSNNLEASLEKNIKGYSIEEGIYEPLKYCNSINDMLHYVHFYVLNDEEMLHSMNVLDKRLNESGEYSILYGKECNEARDIFDNLPRGKREDRMDVVSFDNHIILMVREVGHALTMDIQKENDNYRVYYFIPKTCNVEMINNLRGVKKLDPNNYDLNDPTHGEFVVSRYELGKAIGDFVRMVPTDDNIVNIQNNPKL